MIRKLLVGGAVAAVAALALLLTVGSPAGKPQPAEAVVASISTTTTTVQNDFWAKLHIVAEDDIYGEPYNSDFDVRVTATAGDFGGLDGCAVLIPVWIQVGCAPQLNPVTLVNPSCYYDELLGLMPCIILASNGFPTIPGFPMLLGPADRDIVICNTGESIGEDECSDVVDGPDEVDLLANVTEIELWWRSPGGFPGGTVTFSAWQGTSVKTASIGVLGAPATITLKAIRDESTEGNVCNGIEVKVIAGVEYNFADYDTNFDNNRAVMCAIVKDSNGANLPNVAVQWTTTNGQLTAYYGTPPGGGAVSFTNATGKAYNFLTSGSTGNEGESATVTAQAGSATASVTVEFGGNPATCSLADFKTDLDIGDNMDVVAVFKTTAGNKVPDGIEVYFGEVDSGDGADNVQIADPWQDTVDSKAQANVVAAIAGVTTVYATIYSDGAGDATCSEALDLSGDIHLTPSACAASPSNPILAGSKPPAGGGWGTFLFCGGTNAQLLAATGCTTTSTTIIFYNKPNGGWAAWVVGSQVAAANAEWLSLFPNEHVSIPNPTIFTANCKAPTA